MAITPSQTRPIVDPGGFMEQHFQAWVQEVNGSVMLSGTGTPEGAVVANPTTLYMDVLGGTGTILYIKLDADIGGDKSLGWKLV